MSPAESLAKACGLNVNDHVMRGPVELSEGCSQIRRFLFCFIMRAFGVLLLLLMLLPFSRSIIRPASPSYFMVFGSRQTAKPSGVYSESFHPALASFTTF